MSVEKQRKIKTLEEWKESGKDWDRFCEPGDLVGEDVYWYFLEALPPRSMGSGYLQMGEPHDSRLNPKIGKYASTYMTFIRVEDSAWKYCGNCFAGESVEVENRPAYSNIKEFLKETCVIEYGIQRTRPRIRCRDGFEMSVQAGAMLYSAPRLNLINGEYIACEIGFPNRAEELIEQYAENPRNLTSTVYAYVPVELIDEIIKKHGGFAR